MKKRSKAGPAKDKLDPTSLPPKTLPPKTLPPKTLPPKTLPPKTLPPGITATHVPESKAQAGEPAAESLLVDARLRRFESKCHAGIAVSPGVAVARAHCLHDIPAGSVLDPIDEIAVLNELGVFEEALQRTAAELQGLYEKVASQVGTPEAAVFRTHLAILHDPALLEKIQRLIGEKRLTVAAALHTVARDYEALFAKVADSYLKERVADLRDVLRRLLRIATRTENRRLSASDEPIVLIASELYPSDVVALNEANIVGIVTETGSRTSHAAILARSYGLPAVSGVTGILEEVASGDTVIVDGSGGHVFVNPGAETLRVYRQRQAELARLKTTLAAQDKGPAQTSDGEAVELLANVHCAADIETAIGAGAAGVGLYRTEFYFLTHSSLPEEDEQTEHYRQIIAHSPGAACTIRTLDVGGDKTIPYLTHTHEANPFMGWRSIRLSFEHVDLFLTQIRSILRAAADQTKQVRLLFPMITVPEELQQVHEMVRRARDQLSQDRLPCGSVQIGMMVEVPAAAVTLDLFLHDVDFISIGSNDLVQYLTAADRDNPKVSHLCQALSPAVLRVLSSVIEACLRAETPVTLCGEMAGSPRAFILLLGMGLRCFSMSPAFIPPLRDLAAKLTIPQAQSILQEALRLRTTAAIMELMDGHVRDISPHLVPLLIA